MTQENNQAVRKSLFAVTIESNGSKSGFVKFYSHRDEGVLEGEQVIASDLNGVGKVTRVGLLSIPEIKTLLAGGTVRGGMRYKR